MARPPLDNKMAIEVVDRLKKQGLFDQFRKECLADVDTTVRYIQFLKFVIACSGIEIIIWLRAGLWLCATLNVTKPQP